MQQGAEAGLTAEQAAAAAAGQKGMMPLPGRQGRVRPFLDFVLSALADAGYHDVALVVPPPAPPGTPDPLREYYLGEGRPARVTITFVVQPQARGTADALVSAAAWIGTRPFIVLNADNLYAVEDLRALREVEGPALPVYARDALMASSGIPAERIGAFALLQLSGDGALVDIVEKPGADVVEAAGPHALISMNCWRGDGRILEACRDVPVSPRGEFELPNAIRLALSRGVRVQGVPAAGAVLDLSKREDVPAVMDRLRDVEPRP